MATIEWGMLIREAWDDLRLNFYPYVWSVRRHVLTVVACYVAMIAAVLLVGESMMAFLFPIFMVAVVLITLAITSMAIVWHRHFILHETFTVANEKVVGLRGGYFWMGLLVGLIATVPILLLTGVSAGLSSSEDGGLVGSGIGQAILQMAYFAAFGAFCIVLPARAVGAAMTIGEAWRRTEGHRMQIAFALFAVNFPLLIVQEILTWFETGQVEMAGDASLIQQFGPAVTLLIGFVFNVVLGLATLAIMTRAYIHCGPGKGELTPSQLGS